MQDTPELLNTTLSQGARRVQWGSPCTSGAWARVYVDGVLYDFVSDGIIAIARSAMINAVGNELPTFGPALPVERQVCPREVAVIERNEGGAIIRIKKNFRHSVLQVRSCTRTGYGPLDGWVDQQAVSTMRVLGEAYQLESGKMYEIRVGTSEARWSCAVELF